MIKDTIKKVTVTKSRKEDITMEWYWFAAIAAALAGLYYWFFVK